MHDDVSKIDTEADNIRFGILMSNRYIDINSTPKHN